MGSVSSSDRLQTRICSKTTIHGDKADEHSLQKSRNFSKRNNRTTSKRCNRKSTKSQSKCRFLQYTFSGAKKIWKTETCDKPETPQQVSRKETFQNGHISKSSELSDTRRLGSFDRFNRCLSPHTNFPKTSSISEVLSDGSVLPMESTVFRPNISTQGLYQSTFGSHGSPTHPKYSNSSLLRRPIDSKSVQGKTSCRQGNNHKSAGITRFHNQCRKIVTNTKSNNSVSRNSVPSQAGYCNANKRKSRKTLQSCKSHYIGSKHSKRFSTFAGNHSVMHRNNPKCKTVHETNSVTSPVILETGISKFRKRNTNNTTSHFSSSVVVKTNKHIKRQKFCSKTNNCNHNNRRVKSRLRRSHELAGSSRRMVNCTKRMAYQSARDGSSVSGVETLCTKSKGPQCVDKMRQFDGRTIHKQTRGHSVIPVMLQNVGHVELGHSKQYSDESGPYSRQGQCTSRQIEQTQNSSHRMDSEQNDCSSDISEVGVSNSRPVCVTHEQADRSVLLMDDRFQGSSNRRSVNSMARHVRVCLSPPLSHSESATTHVSIQVPDDSNSPSLAKKTLVHKNSGTTDSMSNNVTSNSGSAIPAEVPDQSSQSRDFQTDGLVSLNRQFEKRGFSEQTRKLLCASWRKGTQKDYVSKFKKFSSWCDSREIDPYTANLTQVAEFLTFLYTSGLQYRTIAGYRSMFSSVLESVENKPVGQHPYIVRLLKGIFNSRPPKARLLPEWDLPRVLKMLEKAPFEPMREATLKHITLKTVFLIAITTFRRCSDLQSLKIGEDSVCVQKKGVTFIRHGLAKQDRPTHYGRKIFVPAFSQNKLLDPKRSLYFYLKKTEIFRHDTEGNDETKLFLAINEPHMPVSSQTISKWIVKTIKMAYNGECGAVKGHSTRAIGTSWALYNGASIKSVLEAADWSRESTFTRFYLRDLEVQVLKSKKKS